MAISTFKRYEKKYLISLAQLDELLPVLSKYMDFDPYCIEGQKYTIYNIYYDDENSDIIRENSNARAYKEKIRLRSYKIANNPEDKVFMEIKKKEKGVGNKRRIKLQLGEVDDLVYRQIPPKVEGYLNKQITNEILYFISKNQLRPTVYLQYDRLALFGKEDSGFRITIDDNIRTRRETFSFGPTDSDELLLKPGTFIMEVKFLGAMPLWLARTLSEMGVFSRGFSKYGTEYKTRAENRELPYYLIDSGGKEIKCYKFKTN